MRAACRRRQMVRSSVACRIRGLAQGELLFLIFLISAVVFVIFLGSLSYAEAKRTETAKAHAQLVVRVFEALAAGESIPTPLQQACRLEEPRGGSTWSGCRAALIADGGSLSGLRNPFDDRQPLFSRQCDRANPATRGAVVVEKGQAPITGAPTVYSPIEDSEPLVRGLMLRIIACDKGSFSTRVKELKL